MNLFTNNYTQNLLPYHGTVEYHGFILNIQECQFYFDALLKGIVWKNDETIIFGKHYITSRKVAWYGNKEYEYTYSNITKKAKLWTKELIELKQKAEKLSKTTYNSCLLNLYHNGNEGMSWHSDNEKTLLEDGTIASISLGADRTFSFKHKTTQHKVDVLLQNGSLLLMKDTTQKHWLHRLPKTKKIHTPRINLTFRTLII